MTMRLDYRGHIPAAMQGLAAVHAAVLKSGLDAALVELVYLRVSQINGCAYCLDMHTRELLRLGAPVEKLALVPAWHEAGALFDARERAALGWAEAVTLVATTRAPDDDYATAAAAFAPDELANLTVAIGLMNCYNRLAVSFRTPPRGAAH
jgi:AhpD family alkylhydroperoxidase